MNKLESLVNKSSDTDWLWWPLLSLRPSKNEIFSFKLTVILSLVATFVEHGIVIFIRLANGQEIPFLFATFLTIFLFVLIEFWYLFVRSCWNKRVFEIDENNA